MMKMAALSGDQWILVAISFIAGFSTTSGTSYTYLGCYSDSATYPDLTGSSSTPANVTADMCCTECRTAGFPYAGLQQGTKCFCGDTFNQRGSSTDCTTCASPNHCGGVLANDVYYTADPGVANRVPMAQSTPNSYVSARRSCIKNGGDLIVPNSQAVVDSIVQLWATSGVTSVWIGLRRRTNTSVIYEWTDETVQPTYYSQQSSFASFWTSGDPQTEGCVSLIIATGKWKSLNCDTALPYTCSQPSSISNEATTQATSSQGESSSKKNKRLALFIVLPIFLFCYGGSCILYCVHKIIKNCTKRKAPAKVPIDQLEGGNRYSDRPPKRPLSASRGRVYPMAPPVTLDLPAKAMPSYIPQTGPPMGGKSATEYNSDRPSSSSGVHLSLGGANQLAPPSYNDDKRARLLENAARESRERRAKEEAEGRPVSRPFSGPKKEPGEDSARDQPSPLSTGSTTNLLGKKGSPFDDDDDDDRTGNNSPMTINEILKQKVQDKKKSKKIVST